MAVVKWHTGTISYLDRAVLDNGNILVAFRDSSDSGKGKFIILSKTGTTVVAETIFKNDSTYYISCTKLNNGNIVIVYALATTSPYNGRFVIYNESGVEVVSEVEFESGSTQYISVTGLNNGNFFIAYKDAGDSSKGKFAIHNLSGTQVKGPTIFSTNWVKYVHVVLLDNTNVFIAYQDNTDSNYGKFQIWDEDGTSVKGVTTFDATNSVVIRDKPFALSNTNVVISYSRFNNKDADFVIYDEDGTEVVGHTIYEDAAFTFNSFNSVTEFKGQIVFAIGEQDDDFGYKYIYTLAGVLVTDKTKFTTGENCRQPNNSIFNNGDLGIVYNGVGGVNGYIYIESAFSPPSSGPDITQVKKLIAAAANTIWYEDI